jgi:methyl-accepting chemotaxis protein
MKNVSLRNKLLIMTMCLISISVFIGGISYYSVNQVIKKYSLISDVSLPNTALILEMVSEQQEIAIEVSRLMNPNVTVENKDLAVKAIEELMTLDQELHKKYMAIEFSEGEEEIYNDFRKEVSKNVSMSNEIISEYQKNKTANLSENPKMAKMYFEDLHQVETELASFGTNIKDFHHAIAAEYVEEAKKKGNEATILILVFISVFGILGLFISYKFSNDIDKMLKNTISVLNTTSDDVTKASLQIAKSSEELSQATTEQAASLQETSASIEEMSSMINLSATNAKMASEKSHASRQKAEHGQNVVKEMINSMKEINESNLSIGQQVEESNKKMQDIVTVIQEIENKTKVINDIVFQTKLLSFNASVEAARAGEQGKGFAVVAEEVGNLAEMSGKASKEISDMLSVSISKVEIIVKENQHKMEELTNVGIKKVERGGQIAEDCGIVLTDIVENVIEVSKMTDEISNANYEQSKGISEVNKAMIQLDQVTHTNTLTTQQTASAADSLSNQTKTLKSEVEQLIDFVQGRQGRASGSTHIAKKEIVEKKSIKVEQKSQADTLAKSKKLELVKNANASVEFLPKKKELETKPKKTNSETASSAVTKTKDPSSIPSYDHPGFEDV